MKSKSVILKSRDLKNLNGLFSVQQRNIEIQNGYILVVKVLAFSIDPVMTVWLSGAQTYFSKTQIGDIFFCFGIGEVIKSNNQNYQVGSLVFGNLGCTEISIIKNQNFLKTLFKIPKQLLQGFTPAEFVYLINNGLAAYGGISLMNLKKQQTVVVSTAAGATGILAIQILKNRGNKVIALTSKNKISSIQNKCDIAVDYKDLKKLNQVLKTNRFEHYFDNVGEWLLDLIIRYISPRGTISLCGATSNYLNFKERDGLKNYSAIISKSLKLNGFNFNMFMSQRLHFKISYCGIDYLIFFLKQIQKIIQFFFQILKKCFMILIFCIIIFYKINIRNSTQPIIFILCLIDKIIIYFKTR